MKAELSSAIPLFALVANEQVTAAAEFYYRGINEPRSIVL